MGKQQRVLGTLIRTGLLAACEERVNLSVPNLTAASVGTPTASVTRSLPTTEVASVRGETPMDLDVVPS